MGPLLLLHGAIGAGDQLQPLAGALGDAYAVHTLNFRGHGGAPDADRFSIEDFAQDALRWMAAQGLSKLPIVGYSMGGYVALYLAARHPEAVESVVTLGTKFRWDEETAARETTQLNPGKIAAKLPAFAAALERRHRPADWKALLQKTADMLLRMGAAPPLAQADYGRIAAPVLLLLGDRDKMVTLEETAAVYRAIPAASLGVLPGTPHPIEQVDAATLAFFVKNFLR